MGQEEGEIIGRLAEALLARGWMLATAESCTGGWIAKRITDRPGSSRWFERGLVTYGNSAKTDLLGVPAALLAVDGAVSEATVRAMVAGLLARSPVQAALAVSGVAGPEGGTAEKPVGLVWIAWGLRGAEPVARAFRFAGDRDAVRRQAVEAALGGLLERLTAHA